MTDKHSLAILPERYFVPQQLFPNIKRQKFRAHAAQDAAEENRREGERDARILSKQTARSVRKRRAYERDMSRESQQPRVRKSEKCINRQVVSIYNHPRLMLPS